MGFFDLSIPYTEPARSGGKAVAAGKTMRVKLATKAMELGYIGIAYNRSIKGVMSEKDRCTIPLLNVGSLVKVAPALASSVGFHRDLLGVPRSTPFRQYTRLTVYVESSAQSQALNSGNPILKSYDIVAVRPLNQNAFDQACERAEVDMISIDFSDKMPFRLKHPMVKAAIQRGIYFEITYSDLLMDAHVRRQVISSAKLLVDWTRGKNLILSSGAPSVTELRGPNDVTNLMSLLGLSKERARAAISKNCRNMISNALRKKRFYKEAVRVELVSSNENFDPERPLPGDWLRWDPLSSGEGDMLLDDLAKAFGTANDTAPKSSKAIDFDSILDDLPSQGFRVKDIIVGNESVFEPPADEVIDKSMQSGQVSEPPLTVSTSPDANHLENQTLTHRDVQISADDKKVEPKIIATGKEPSALRKCNFSVEPSRVWEGVAFQTLGTGMDVDAACHPKTHISSASKDRSASNSDNGSAKDHHVENLNTSIVAIDEVTMDVDGKEGASSLELHDMSLGRDVEEKHISGLGHDTVVDVPMSIQENCDEMKVYDSSAANHGYTEVAITENQKHETGDNEISLPSMSSGKTDLVGEPHERLIQEVVVSDQVLRLGSTGETELREESLVPHLDVPEETITEDKKEEETETGTNHRTSVQSPEVTKDMNSENAGITRAKKKITIHQTRLLPFKHFLHPSRFKRIRRKSKHRRVSS